MIFDLEEVAYPVQYANYQRNSNVPVKVRPAWSPAWQKEFTEVDPELVMSPLTVVIRESTIAVKGSSELLVYDSTGELKFVEQTASPSPVIFGQKAMAFFHPSYQLVYQDYEQNRLQMAEPISEFDEYAFALLVKPSAEEVLAVVQFTGVRGQKARSHYVYKFVRENLSNPWIHEFPKQANHALLTPDGGTIVMIREDEMLLFNADNGEMTGPFKTGLATSLTASISPTGLVLLVGLIEDGAETRVMKALTLDGNEAWTMPLADPQMGQPAACGSDGQVYVVDAMHLKCIVDGEARWAAVLDSDDDTRITITEDNHAVVVNGPKLMLFDGDGKRVFESVITKQPERFNTPPAIDSQGRIFVTSNTTLYCFE